MDQVPSGYVNAAPPQTSGHMAGGNLAIAVDRLDRALKALETRVRALQAGEALPLSVEAQGAVPQQDYQRLLDELDLARAHNAALNEAAEGAFMALGTAASDIRHLLGDGEA